MNYLSDNSLGGQLKPIHNNIELTKAMKGRRNCYLYTVGTFQVNKENLDTLKINNIKLVGLAFAPDKMFEAMATLNAGTISKTRGVYHD